MNTDNTDNKANDPAHAVQGEGDYDAARRYDKSVEEFAKSGKVEQAARDAKPTSEAEADELRQAEQEGKSHAKGEDPLLQKGRQPGR